MHICVTRPQWVKKNNKPSVECKDQFTLHSQSHGCWWPGSLCRQGISSHGIDLILQTYIIFSPTRVNDFAETSGWSDKVFPSRMTKKKHIAELIYIILSPKCNLPSPWQDLLAWTETSCIYNQWLVLWIWKMAWKKINISQNLSI